MVSTRTVVLSGVVRHPNANLPQNKTMHIITMVDRRTSPPAPPIEWMLQAELEDLLYPSVITMGTSGAFYRLLGRSPAGNNMTLSLRRNSVAAELVTEDEFTALKALMHTGVREARVGEQERAGGAGIARAAAPCAKAAARHEARTVSMRSSMRHLSIAFMRA